MSRFTSAMTSGPMPSPASRRSLWVDMGHRLVRFSVMAGLVPAIHVLPSFEKENVDARQRPGMTDEERADC
jgi:hypothetical protein